MSRLWAHCGVVEDDEDDELDELFELTLEFDEEKLLELEYGRLDEKLADDEMADELKEEPPLLEELEDDRRLRQELPNLAQTTVAAASSRVFRASAA